MFALKCQIVDLVSSLCLDIILPSKEGDSQAEGLWGGGGGARRMSSDRDDQMEATIKTQNNP